MLRWKDELKAWERAKPIVPKDKIISSEFSTRGNKCHFHPSYNCEGDPDMKKLIEMEYDRMWKCEHFHWSMKQSHVKYSTKNKKIDFRARSKKNNKP